MRINIPGKLWWVSWKLFHFQSPYQDAILKIVSCRTSWCPPERRPAGHRGSHKGRSWTFHSRIETLCRPITLGLSSPGLLKLWLWNSSHLCKALKILTTTSSLHILDSNMIGNFCQDLEEVIFLNHISTALEYWNRDKYRYSRAGLCYCMSMKHNWT